MAFTFNETPRQLRALQLGTASFNAANAGKPGWVDLTVAQYANAIINAALNNALKSFIAVGGGSVALQITNAERTALVALANTNAEVKALLDQVRSGTIDLSDDLTLTRIALLVSNGAMTQARVDAVFAV